VVRRLRSNAAGLTCLTAALLLFGRPVLALEDVALPDYLELRAQLKAGNYEKVETTLDAFQRGFESGRHSDEVVSYAFSAFATTDKSLEEPLAAWAEARPDSYAAALSQGYYEWHQGWVARGCAWREDTNPRRFEAMTGYFRRAERELERAILLNRHLSVAYAALVNIHMAQGRRGEMDWAHGRGLVVVPKSREIRRRYLYGMLPKWGGSMIEIEGLVGGALREHAEVPYLASLAGMPDYAKADQLTSGGKRQAAVEHFDRALSRGEDLWITFQRGENHLSLGNLGGALADANRLLAESPDSVRFLNFRGRVYRRMKRPDLALADWNRAIELDPLDPHYLKNRAALHRDEKQYRKALIDLDDALVFGAYDASVRAQRGSLFLYDLKRAGKAVSEYRLATSLAPDVALHWYNLSGALYRTLNCDFIDAGRRYLELCKAAASCKQDLVDWVEAAIEAEIRHKACPG